MASFNITGFSTASQTLGSGELGYIDLDASLVVSSGNAVDVNDGGDLVNLGAIVARSTATSLDAGGSIRVGAFGSINSTEGDGIDLSGVDGHRYIVNEGSINGYSDGMAWSSIAHNGSLYEVSLVNTGTIIGQTGRGVNIATESGGGSSSIQNSGTIIGAVFGLDLDSVQGAAGAASVMNSGLISGAEAIDSRVVLELVNTGQIISTDVDGDFVAIGDSSQAANIVNLGEIVGHVMLGGGDDRFDGRGGTISGEIHGEAGADVLIAGDHDTRLYGGTENDSLFGGSANDRLDGGAGNDRMEGKGGNDIYIIASQFDSVVEELDGGTDRVISYISHTLDENVEVLELVSGNINGTGNAGDNIIIGTSGNNILNGGAGRDELRGEAGADTFVFNTALSEDNVDLLSDFNSADDKIQLDQDVFTNLSLGFISSSELAIGSQAWTADQRIVYDPTTGALMYDRDGSGAADAVQFAQLEAGTNVIIWDFEVI